MKNFVSAVLSTILLIMPSVHAENKGQQSAHNWTMRSGEAYGYTTIIAPLQRLRGDAQPKVVWVLPIGVNPADPPGVSDAASTTPPPPVPGVPDTTSAVIYLRDSQSAMSDMKYVICSENWNERKHACQVVNALTQARRTKIEPLTKGTVAWMVAEDLNRGQLQAQSAGFFSKLLNAQFLSEYGLAK